MKKKYLITIDLGGTKILSALIDQNNKIVNRVKVPTEIKNGKEQIVDDIANSVKKLIEESKINSDEIKAVSLGVPGTVNPETGVIGNAPNLKIKDYNIRKALEELISLPVLLENDVNLAALGIKKYEFNDEVNNMLVVFIGTGIGGALIFNGNIYRGSTFFAGEIGHMKVNSDGTFSPKSGTSTFEKVASRTAVVKAINKEIKNGKKSELTKIVSSKKKIKSKSLALAVSKKDEVVVRHLTDACKTIGTVLGSLTTLLNVDTIVLGGGVIEAIEDFMVPKIKESFSKAVLPEPGKEVKIVATKLGDDAPLYGGIALAEEFIKD